jgi:ATP-binding cassette subfamily F protein 3
VLHKLDLRIDQDDRIALLGANGNGKSTFAKLLADRLPWREGEIVRAPGMQVALFAQHQIDDLRPAETPVDHVRRLMPAAPESKVRARVAQMGLDTARMDTKAADLSGGEKARLLLGLIAYDGPQLLILDEPTNHLDMDARETLMMALNDFSGAVILISHDRHLIEAVAERLWLVRDGRVLPYDGDMEDYRSEVLTGRRPNRKPVRPDQASAPLITGQGRRKAAAGRRQTLAPLVKKIKEIEAMMANLQKSIQAIDSELAAQDLYETQPQKAAQLSRRRSETEKRLIGLEEEWLDLSSQLEMHEQPT